MKRTWFPLTAALFLNLTFSGCSDNKHGSSQNEDTSELKLETDDSPREELNQLVDVSGVINAHVQKVIQKHYKGPGAKDAKNRVGAILENIMKDLTKARKGTGVGIGKAPYRLEVSVLTEIEAWAIETLSASKKELFDPPFMQSRYRKNPVGAGGLLKGQIPKKPSHATLGTAEHSIAPVIRLKDHFIGIDKLAHFFEQGYWLFSGKVKEDATDPGRPLTKRERRDFSRYMEGDPTLDKATYPKYKKLFASFCPNCASFGYYGSASTGVISFADMNANDLGYSFYVKLEKSILKGETFTFNILSFDVPSMNEHLVPNRYDGIVETPCDEK